MMSQFIDNNKNICEEIEATIASDDIHQAYRLAHNLKNHAGIIEKPVLQRAALAVESALANGVNRLLPNDMDKLRLELDKVLQELFPMVKSAGLQKFEDVSVNEDEFLSWISELEPLLEDGNLKYVNYVDKLRGREDCVELILHMENFNAPAAAIVLAELKRKWI